MTHASHSPSPSWSGDGVPVSVVIATQNRWEELTHTLGRLEALPERPEIVVVDNASTDGTAEHVRRDHPGVRVIALERNVGAAARNVGAAVAANPLIAFSDDDSWWAPRALVRAAEHFAAHPRLGLLAARILVGSSEALDPVCAYMSTAPLGSDSDLPGPSVLGFLACGAVVRRDAFLSVGGFHPRFLVGGEERMVALDLASAGWGLAYVDDVVAHHHPSVSRNPARRRVLERRNDLWSLWLRRPAPVALGHTARVARAAVSDPAARAGLMEAVRHGAWVLPQRRVIHQTLERQVRLLD